MGHADVVVSAFSTAALEVAIFDKPLVSVGFDGHKKRPIHRSVKRFEQFTHFQDFMKLGGVSVTRSFNELFNTIDAFLMNKNLGAENRERLRNEMCYKLDGKAGERIVNSLLRNVIKA